MDIIIRMIMAPQTDDRQPSFRKRSCFSLKPTTVNKKQLILTIVWGVGEQRAAHPLHCVRTNDFCLSDKTCS